MRFIITQIIITFSIFQGHTVKFPDSLILDLVCWLQPAMCYVALSRVQCLDQLYILDKLPVEKMIPWPDALVEKDRLDQLDRERILCPTFSICSLNINSLDAHYEDILVDKIVINSTILCFQETWLSPEHARDIFPIENKISHFNSVRRGAGIVTYIPEDFKHEKDFTAVTYQMSVFSSEDKIVVNIYRSNNANTETFLKNLSKVVNDRKKETFLCGDWNICVREDKNHPIIKFLLQQNFSPVLELPKPTHKEGRCIDMIWARNHQQHKFSAHIDFKYYTDHGQLSYMNLV